MCAVSEDGVLLWLRAGLGCDPVLCSGDAAVTQPWSCFANTASKAAAKGSEEDYSQEWGSQDPVPLATPGWSERNSAWARSAVLLLPGEQWSPAAAFRQHSLSSAHSSNASRVCRAGNPPASLCLGQPCTPHTGAIWHSGVHSSAFCWHLALVHSARKHGAGSWSSACSLCPASGHRLHPVHSLNLHRTKQNTLSGASTGCY